MWRIFGPEYGREVEIVGLKMWFFIGNYRKTMTQKYRMGNDKNSKTEGRKVYILVNICFALWLKIVTIYIIYIEKKITSPNQKFQFLFKSATLFNMICSLAPNNLRISTPLLASFLAFKLTVFYWRCWNFRCR